MQTFCYRPDMKLFPFQADTVAQVIDRFKGRALVALDMGLGKTPIALACVKFYAQWPVIVVCPASLRLNWALEIKNWLGMPSTVIRKATDSLSGNIIIISYEAATKRALELALLNPFMVILDESHYVKNRAALRTKQLVPVCRRAPKCLLLTGTPVLNRPVELWTQLAALNISFGDFFQYARRYCNAHKTRFGWDFNGASNIPALNKLLLGSCMVRKLKSEVLTELPAKRRVRLSVDGIGRGAGSGLVQLCLDALKSTDFSLGRAMDKLRSQKNADLSSAVFKAYSELAEHKLKAACEIATDMAGQTPLVIFAHHKILVQGIWVHLMKHKIPSARIDGSTSLDDRQEAVEGFQKEKYRAIVCSLTAASTGITLTRASNMLIVELPWSPGVALQAEDRIHRIGQNAAVLIQYLVATGTLDEAMWKSISRKASVSHSILDGHSESEFQSASEHQYGDFWSVIESTLSALAEAQQPLPFKEKQCQVM